MEKIINFDCRCQRRHNKENSEQRQQQQRTVSSCSQSLDPGLIWRTRAQTMALSRDHRDLFLLGTIMTCMSQSEMTRSTKKVNTKRKISRSTYMVNGVVVCRATFCFVYGISHNLLHTLKQHYKENGLKSRQRKLPSQP